MYIRMTTRFVLLSSFIRYCYYLAASAQLHVAVKNRQMMWSHRHISQREHTKSVYMFSAFQADSMCRDEIIGSEVSNKNDGLLGNSQQKFRRNPSWYCEELAWINVKEFKVTHTHTQNSWALLFWNSKCLKHIQSVDMFCCLVRPTNKKSLHLCLKADNDKRYVNKEKQTKIKNTD